MSDKSEMNNTAAQSGEEPIIRVSHLKEYFPINTGFIRTKPLKAVDDMMGGGLAAKNKAAVEAAYKAVKEA